MHRVADREQGAPVTGRPAGGEPFQQIVLGIRSVLEFIDQDVTDAIVERQREIGRRLGTSQRGGRGVGNGREIDLSAAREHQHELGGGHGQQMDQRLQHLPLAVVVHGWWQLHQRGQFVAQTVERRELFDQIRETLLGGIGTAFLFRRKTQILVEPAAPLPFPGQQ